MRFNLFVMVAAVGFAMGCAYTPPPTASNYDPVTGRRTEVSQNLLPSPENPREVVWLNMYQEYRNARNVNHYFEVIHMAPKDAGSLEIPAGESLTLVADGESMRFTGNGSMNRRKTLRRNKVDFVEEMALYEVKRTDLQKLASAKSIKVQLKGNNGLVEREFGPENYENLKAFVDRVAR